MTKILVDTESVLSSLFLLGYDKVDAAMFTQIMLQLKLHSYRKSECECYLYNKKFNCYLEHKLDDELSNSFLNITEYFNGGYKILDNLKMNSDVSDLVGLDNECLLVNYLGTNNNRLLASYIDNKIDMVNVIMNKIYSYKIINNYDNYPDLFCDKEKEILYKTFGIDKLHEKQEKTARYKLTKRLEDDLK